MEVVDALRALGGAARWKQLRGHVGWRAIKRARNAGMVTCVDGLWTLAGADRAAVAAAEHRGVLSHASAAAHWGFALPPPKNDGPDVRLTVPPGSNRRHRPADIGFSYRALPKDDVDGTATTPLRTVIDCLRDESLRVALSVGDSALRSGLVVFADLAERVGALRGPGAALARKRLAMLDARAANAFESCMRAILLDAGVAGFRPQVSIHGADGWIGIVDLANRVRRIVIECDGFETHGGRAAFVKDLLRFTRLVSAGWRPLRFTWEQVMFRPEWVLARVLETIALTVGGGALRAERGAGKAERLAA